MGTPTKEEYAAFEERVRRTVYVDNLSPLVTEAVLRTALDQFGTVKSVQVIPNYIVPGNIPRCALVEMENSKEAKAVVSEITQLPFMISGMPRPVRARPAEVEMFDDRPRKPDRKILCRWLEPSDPDFEVAKRLKHLCREHSRETEFLIKRQLQEEEKLAKKQADELKTHYKKHELIEGVMSDGTAQRLGRRYNLRLDDR
ncbi:Splicing factor-like protein [Parasponia andersonii]|uniref:Splicing factor-like protein n=1 Tax=Parasponia andersonii TaxID=3476 RepID=A0A2P5CSK1_PARAD|nr:Splicing factor-like protein [Parasponia andersonii]